MESVPIQEMDIKSMIKVIKLIKQQNKSLSFEIGMQQFDILLPEDKNGYFYIELPITLDGFNWLARVNEYIFEKQPTLDKLLEHIETKYAQEKKKKQSIEDKKKEQTLFDIPDLNITQFDISEQKYRKFLESKLDSTKRTLNLSTNTNNTPILFSGKTPGLVILNEFIDLRKKYSTDIRIELSLTNDNVYNWNLKFRNFTNDQLSQNLKNLKSKYGYDYIEIEILFHDKLYPGYPPFIRSVRPRLQNSLMNRITNMKMVQFEYWTPSRGMDFIINKLLGALDKHCLVDFDSEMNDIKKYPSGSYHSLESILIKLASLCDVKDEFEPLDTEDYKKVMNNTKSTQTKSTPTKSTQIKSSQQKSGTIWKSGTGFDGSNWDSNDYIKLQQEKDNQIQSVINTLIDNLTNFDSNELPIIYKILESSYVIPFIKSYMRGSNMLEMSKHENMYKLLFTFLQLLVTDESIFLFDKGNRETGESSLYEILSSLYKEAEQTKKFMKDDKGDENGDISLMICTLFEMIHPIFQKYTEERKHFIEEENKKWQKKLEEAKSNANQEHLKYQETMTDMNFDTCDFTSSFYHKTEGSLQASKQMIRHISKEYASLNKCLPVYFESSVFVRVDQQDTRRVKVLITGPDNTPYDSGCFIFDVFTGNDYPKNTPKMQFRNHGGKRFNPNLYACGKVCLSLLGTWGGQGSEAWNPNTSTLQQLFISVQAQILVPEPFYNEPGYETRFNSPQGKEQSRQYTNERRYYTLLHAMYDLISNPNLYPEFKDVIINHFKLKKDYILKLCDIWKQEPTNSFGTQTEQAIEKVKSALNAL